MSLSKVHVFIATTQGLVAVQSITPLQDNMPSIFTVNGDSKASALSDKYASFVAKNTGLISSFFCDGSFRLDLSADIDQGNSWQLGVFLAHLYFIEGLLGDGSPKEGDTVLCASGVVSSIDHSIKQIDQLSLKLQIASGQVDHWISNGVYVTWLLPTNNSHDASLAEFGYHFIFSDDIRQSAELLNDAGLLESALAPAAAPMTGHNKRHAISYKLPGLFGFALLLGTVILVNGILSDGDSTRLHWEQSASGSCDFAVQGYTHSFEDELTRRMPLLKLDTLCRVEIYNQHAQSIWLVSDSGSVIELSKIDDYWPIPLPTNRNLSRHFTLVVSDNMLDKADKQSFERYLEIENEKHSIPGMVRRNETFTEREVAAWFDSQNYVVNYLSGKFSIE